MRQQARFFHLRREALLMMVIILRQAKSIFERSLRDEGSSDPVVHQSARKMRMLAGGGRHAFDHHFSIAQPLARLLLPVLAEVLKDDEARARFQFRTNPLFGGLAVSGVSLAGSVFQFSGAGCTRRR